MGFIIPMLVGAFTAVLSFFGTRPDLVLTLLGNRGSIADGDLSEVQESFTGAIVGVICDYAQNKAGLVLDRSDPLSDASMSSAVGARIGIELTSLRDIDVLKTDISRFASAQVEAKTGIVLSDIMDAAAIKTDVASFASAKVSEHAGVALSNVLDVDTTKTELTAWALDNFVGYVQTRLTEVAGGVGGVPIDLSCVGDDTKRNLADGMASSDILGQAFAGLVKVLLAKARTDLQRSRRKEQNRHAQRRFRALHGNRMRYDRLEGGAGP